jgi:hypothetical protein
MSGTTTMRPMTRLLGGFFVALALALCALPARAAEFRQISQIINSSGNPVVNGYIYIGTYGLDPVTNPISLFSDSALSVPIANPVRTDSYGRPTTDVYFSEAQYSYTLKTSALVTIEGPKNRDAIPTAASVASSQAGTATWGGTAGGTANAITLSLTPAITAYTDGMSVRFRVASDNTGAVTVSINGVGARNVVKWNGTALAAGDLQSNDDATIVFDTTSNRFMLQSPAIGEAARVDVASVAGTTVLDTSGTQYVQITGTNTITAITLADGRWRDVLAGGAFAITSGASLIIEGLSSGVTYRFASGDRFSVRGEAANVVRVQLHQPPRLDAVTATTEVVSSLAETTVYTKSIPGGTLGVDRALRLTIIGDYLNNSGATQDLRVRVKYGATTIADANFNTIAGSASRKTFRMVYDLHAKGATNSQVGAGIFALDFVTAGSTPTTGLGTFQGSGLASGHNAVAIDSTADQNLVVTVTLSASSANLSFKMLSARVEVIR